MKAKKMKKLLMAAGAERNLANKIAGSCGSNMSHEDMFWNVLFNPEIVKVFRAAVRYGAQTKAEYANLPDGEAFRVLRG